MKSLFLTFRKQITAQRLDEDGDVVQIYHSTRSRDSFLGMPIEGVDELYRALKTFTELIYDKAGLIEIKQKPGKYRRYMITLMIVVFRSYCGYNDCDYNRNRLVSASAVKIAAMISWLYAQSKSWHNC